MRLGRTDQAGSGTSGGNPGLGEPRAGQGLEEDLGVLAGHVGVGPAVSRQVAEVAEAIDDLLGGSAADASEATARSAAPASSTM